MSPPDFDFADVLRRMVETRASDVHITPGFPPAIRDLALVLPDVAEALRPLLTETQEHVRDLQADLQQALRSVQALQALRSGA